MSLQDLYATDNSWCRGACAKDKDGKTVPSDSKAAVQWCPIGALLRVYGGGMDEYCEGGRAQKNLVAAIKDLWPKEWEASSNGTGSQLATWNDKYGSLAKVRKAAEAARV